MTQSEALDILKTGRNVFLTGAAGSGKTYTLRAYLSWLAENGIAAAVTASTGIAATHIGGMTIHSWSGLGIRAFLSAHDLDTLLQREHLVKRYEKTKVLVIDEVSMLHHFRFDQIDRLARMFRRVDEPFGGMQVVLCGDFFQLPPVSRYGEPESRFAYASDAWKSAGFTICYLEEQHRQSDDAYLSVLDAIRSGDIDEGVYELLQDRHGAEIAQDVVPTKLSTHNDNVDAINDRELAKLTTASKQYPMSGKGSKALLEALMKSCLAPERLFLKLGARVMFVKNNFEKGYVNGTLGEVVKFDVMDTPIVRIASGKEIAVVPEEWRVDEEGKVKASISQLPLRLAWAITVHKSQGMSLDAAEIDLSRSFVPGMGYVALSRVRSLAGLRLVGFNQQALMIHPEVRVKDAQFREASRAAVGSLLEMGAAEALRRAEEFVAKNSTGEKRTASNGGSEEADDMPSHHQTRVLILEKLPLGEIAKRRELKEETIISHIERLIEEKVEVDISHLRPTHYTDTELELIFDAFMKTHKKHGDLRLAPVKAILTEAGHPKISYDELRLARLFCSPGEEPI
ncbi:MAG: AAA family ATPase [Patescibacteria group bacterium]